MMFLSVEQLLSYAASFAAKFQQESETLYIDGAIILDREALALCRPGQPEKSTTMTQLACHLWMRFNQLGKIDDLNEAVVLGRDALALRPPGDADRSAFLNNLAVHLSTRYNQLGETDDLNESIVLVQEALALHPPGHPRRSTPLSSLASNLSIRYGLFGAIDDLNEAIVLERDALALRPLGDANRSTSLSDLSLYLCTRYERLKKIDDLNEAIVRARDALALHPPGHLYRPTSLNNLSSRLSIRYKQFGEIDDLDQAIILLRDALALCQPGYPDQSIFLSNLALHLSTRYNRLRGPDDIEEAIILSRKALEIRPQGHPGRATSLNNLTLHLLTRYKYTRVGRIEEAIDLAEESLALRPPGHPDRSAPLNNLAVLFSSRYEHLGEANDLDKAIVLAREVLERHPPGHLDRVTSLNNLASHLFTRYRQLWRIDDLDEAITLEREALSLYAPGHPVRSNPLNNLAQCLLYRFKQLDGIEDQQELFSLYAEVENISDVVSSYDLTAAKGWIDVAEYLCHPTLLLAYKTALRLLVQHLTILPPLPQHLSVFQDVSSSLAADAFSAFLRNQSYTNAVELLEQGRGVFWNQLSRLRSPLEDLVASGPAGKALSDEFTRQTSHIRAALDSPGADQHERIYYLNLELQKVVSGIRELPGLSRFLLPPSFIDLQRAAIGGPVIIMNASQYGCDVLVVFVDRDPVHIPLSITKDNVRSLSLWLRSLTKRAKTMDVTRDLGIFLRELWDRIVSRIVDFLQTTCPRQSRIWWCPSAEFSLLPLHAAGPYRKGQQNLSALYISSYTPTLTALIRARRPTLLHSATQKRFIAIGQAAASGAVELHSVGSELVNIGQLVDGPATFTRIEGSDSSVSRVADELGKNGWVHFACHGFANRKQPFESAFALRDGRFTIQHIIRGNLQDPEFAYLSACHTTAGDEERPDEMIHLAAAMQFAGFRSVIGTMWSVDDAETGKITSVFYKHMVDESGHLDHTRAASALRKTMRSADTTLDQRILYVHLGA